MYQNNSKPRRWAAPVTKMTGILCSNICLFIWHVRLIKPFLDKTKQRPKQGERCTPRVDYTCCAACPHGTASVHTGALKQTNKQTNTPVHARPPPQASAPDEQQAGGGTDGGYLVPFSFRYRAHMLPYLYHLRRL